MARNRFDCEPRIADMGPGSTGWAVSWAIDEEGDFLCLRGSHSVSPSPGGTVILRVEYLSPGTRVISLCADDCSFGYEYAKDKSIEHKIPFDTEVVVPVV